MILINELNGKIIFSKYVKDVYIHDDVLEELYFERRERRLQLFNSKCGEKDLKYSIDFQHVIGFEMTACDFWGCSPRILDFEYVEHDDRFIIPKLFKIKEEHDCPDSFLDDQEKYIETVITFISGDRLTIACENIIIHNP